MGKFQNTDPFRSAPNSGQIFPKPSKPDLEDRHEVDALGR
ncbi:hypothetical protein CSC43_0510 [Pseudomonas aeruginosa]|nr:hypothetical protein CSC43_0510 [Pseudomonas aeruginosa]